MSNKSTRSPSQAAQQKAEDFRLIKGLPKTAKAKLQAAGITTFAQLAAMSPHELAAAIGDGEGTTAERIVREDWIGQASKFIVRRETLMETDLEPADALPVATPNHNLTSFVLELRLNEDRTVRQTRVLHVESEESEAEKKWAGWDEIRLLNFVVHCAKIALPPQLAREFAPNKEKAAVISVEERVQRLEAKSPSAPTLAANHIQRSADSVNENRIAEIERKPAAKQSKLEVFVGGFDIPSGSALNGGEYKVKVSLNESEIRSLGTGPMAYTVKVYAKSLTASPANKQHLTIGESLGVVGPASELEFDLEGAKLAQGAYRLQATASFRSLSSAQGAERRRNFTTFVEGGVLQVY